MVLRTLQSPGHLEELSYTRVIHPAQATAASPRPFRYVTIWAQSQGFAKMTLAPAAFARIKAGPLSTVMTMTWGGRRARSRMARIKTSPGMSGRPRRLMTPAQASARDADLAP